MLEPGAAADPAPRPTAVVDPRPDRTAQPPSLVRQGCTVGDLPPLWGEEETTASPALVSDLDRRELTSTAVGALPYQPRPTRLRRRRGRDGPPARRPDPDDDVLHAVRTRRLTGWAAGVGVGCVS